MGSGNEGTGRDGRHLHGGVWRDEYEWPLARSRFTPYYLHADGSLKVSAPLEVSSSTGYDYDPLDPVPSIGGNVSSAMEIMRKGRGIRLAARISGITPRRFGFPRDAT